MAKHPVHIGVPKKKKKRKMPSKSEVLRIGTDAKGNPIFLNQVQASKAAIKKKRKK